MLLLLTCGGTYAQAYDSGYIIPKSTVRNTSFTSLFLVDSFSKAGDSAAASSALLRINPYMLLRMAYTPANLDSFFLGYTITAQAKSKYRKTFAAIYNTPETEEYKLFKKMVDEDQEARLHIGDDSLSRAVGLKNMIQSDSVHFDYLRRYVKKNGWPALSNGSLYAWLLAWHDYDHCREYLPYVKKAVLAGQVDNKVYDKMVNRMLNPTFLDLATKFKNKVSFDVSYIQNLEIPNATELALMKKAVNDHLPIKYIYFVYESNNEKDFNKFLSGGGNLKGVTGWSDTRYGIAWDLMMRIVEEQRNRLSTDSDIPYNFVYSESSSPKKKLTLYLLY
ncbi:MAG: hypothetical protein JWQ38_355 [Flavipsychrobacter sp.]|nr:hypothetical protein [Flavipsychrobacter sp.]